VRQTQCQRLQRAWKPAEIGFRSDQCEGAARDLGGIAEVGVAVNAIALLFTHNSG